MVRTKETARKGDIDYIDGLIQQRKLEDAETALVNLLRDNPRQVDAYPRLAEVEWLLGDRSRAILTLEEWLKYEPQNAIIWYRLGAMHQVMNEADKAMDAFKNATEIDRDKAANWVGLAIAAMMAQRPQEVERVSEHLNMHFPKLSMTHVIKGHVHKMLGEEESAINAYHQALTLESDLVTALYNLVDIKVPAPDDALVKHIAALSKKEKLANADKVNLFYALGRIYDKAQQYDTAFTHYTVANKVSLEEMAKYGITYKPKEIEAQIDHTIQCYDVSYFQDPIEPLPIDLTLIFIVGLPRSGTTLIEQIVTAHPQVTAGGELPITHKTYQYYAKRRAELSQGNKTGLPKQQEDDLLLEAREYYLDALFEYELEGDYITNKLPADFEILGFIRRLFPQAIIIHCQRDLMATCWSLYTSNFGMHEPYYNCFESLAHYCHAYCKLMRHWESTLDPSMVKVAYEELVRESETEIRKLINNIQLPWDEACLSYYDNPGNVLTASYQQVRQPIYTTSLDKWRHYEEHLDGLVKLLWTE